jgi:tripartite-type tricarboxylate transporter receptor subunit TctC
MSKHGGIRFATPHWLAGAAAVVISGAAAAQAFPTKPISFIVPYGPGTGNDLIARVIAQKVGDDMGRPMVVENRPGATGAIGADLTAKAPPDGHTILIASTSHITNAYVNKVNYDLLRDFSPVIRPARMAYVLAVPNASPAKTIKELVALAKANPGSLSYGGVYASVSHFMGEVLKSAGQIDISLVTYKGTNDAAADVIANRIGLWFTTTATGIPLAKAGKVRIIGVCSKERLAVLPEVPTVVEAGFPALNLDINFYILATAKSPGNAIATLNQHIGRALATQDVKEKLALQSVEATVTTPEETAAILKHDIGEWGRIIKQSGIKMQ